MSQKKEAEDERKIDLERVLAQTLEMFDGGIESLRKEGDFLKKASKNLLTSYYGIYTERMNDVRNAMKNCGDCRKYEKDLEKCNAKYVFLSRVIREEINRKGSGWIGPSEE